MTVTFVIRLDLGPPTPGCDRPRSQVRLIRVRMKFVLECVVFSDGSTIITCKPGFSSSGAFKVLTRGINNDPSWSGVSSEHQT